MTFMTNGKILSGAMDSKLCLWSGTKATNLTGVHLLVLRGRLHRRRSQEPAACAQRFDALMHLL